MDNFTIEEENKKRNKKWSEGEMQILLKIWKSKKEELKGPQKKNRIFVDMVKQMRMHHHISVTLEELKTKMCNLKSKYRKEKKIIEPFGDSTSEWPYYYAMTEIMDEIQFINCVDVKDESSILDYSTHGDNISTASSSSAQLSTNSKNLEIGNKIIEKFIKNSVEVDRQSLENEKVLIELERRKIEILQKMYDENKIFNELLLKKM